MINETTFTTAEYVAKHDLNVDMRDSFAVKMIAKHLKALGYKPRRTRDGQGKSVTVWTKTDREKQLLALQAKLNRLEGKP